MGRKVFQDLAHVMCQQFLETPSNLDLVDLAIMGNGVLVLAITDGKATHNGLPIEPLPFSGKWLAWAESRLGALNIPRDDMKRAELHTDYTVALDRNPTFGWLRAEFDFTCVGTVAAADHEYVAEMQDARRWSLWPIANG